MIRSFRTLVLGAIVAAPGPLLAQQAAPRAPYNHASDAPQAVAARVSGTIRVDGTLDEAAWATATPITRFVQYNPTEGEPATERSDIRILYDDDALYFGARLHDRQPVRSRVGRRDMGMSASDWLTIIIDARHDHLTAFGFEINPAGVRRDQTRTQQSEDDSWEPVWEGRTSVSDSGWVAEIRIPFSQLRFAGEASQTWGLQIERQIARNQEFSVWSFTPRDEPGGIPRFGHLTGIQNVATGKRLEVMPYAVSRAEFVDRGANPFRSNREYDGEIGADLKFRVTSSLTLDATVNPDFGQVEVDPAVINLTAFETFFEERRPFFVEGSELFNFGNDGTNSLFYSRRIGRQPSLAPPYEARDVPDASRILGAAKLTGRTGGGWTMGVMEAITRRELARFRTPGGETGESVAEPLTNYFVARARRELRSGQTTIGGLIGAVNRDLDSPELEGALRSAAYSGGLDFRHEWAQRTFSLVGFVAASHVRGSERVIAATQRLPYHYFQRPDADHLDFDTTRTSLTGLAANLGLSKQLGRYWNFGGGINTITPGYETSDLGFQRRADRIDVQLNTNFNDTRIHGPIRRISSYFTWLYEHNYDWQPISHRVFTGSFFQFLNYYGLSVNFQTSLPGTLDDRLTRGGPLAKRPGTWSGNAYLSSDPRKSVVAELNVSTAQGTGGDEFSVSPALTIKPRPHWEVSVGPSYSASTNTAQYLQRVLDPAATQTFGARYVFAEVEQKTLAIETRVNYTFTPELSLQVYAQPFVASGDYGPAKELAAPRTYRFLEYGRDVGQISNGTIYPNGTANPAVSFPVPAPDFNFRSLRGNAVLRWEWRPGSTMYVAWQQTRESFLPIGDFSVRRDLDALFARAPDDVLLVKVSYWLNP